MFWNGNTAMEGLSGRGSGLLLHPLGLVRRSFVPRMRLLRSPQERANRLLNILDLLLAKVSERKGQNFSDLIVRHTGDAGPAGTGERLQSCGDVDAIAKEVAAFDHHRCRSGS